MINYTTLLEHALARRKAIDSTSTTAYRLINAEGDGMPGVVVDRLGDVILIQSKSAPQESLVEALLNTFPSASIYFKTTTSHVRQLDKQDASPILIQGTPVQGRFAVIENNVMYSISMEAGYSVGLFLDQRDNRRSIHEMALGGRTVLNTFAYTCAFSVCAALAGATVTSIDLSKKYLDWGRDNFRANHLDDTVHDFIYGDVFDWLPRFTKKDRRWDFILLDPPTFSATKAGRTFKATKDYPKLIELAKAALTPNGAILACMNTHDVSPTDFCELTGVQEILPMPCDFPVAPKDTPHLKSGWIHPAS